ncbi:Hypothetical protein AJF4211_000140 [Avibacterium paragallinarum JF4211]|nr:Hypothetical protein AJF4211_000140 [Avibacterium paragallinarum JF4211]
MLFSFFADGFIAKYYYHVRHIKMGYFVANSCTNANVSEYFTRINPSGI